MIPSSHPVVVSPQESFIYGVSKNTGLNPTHLLGTHTPVLYKRNVSFSLKCNVSYLGVKNE